MGKYDQFMDDAAPAANLNLRFGVEASSDEAAEAAKLARRYQLPVGVVSEFRGEYKQQAQLDDARAVVDKSPKLKGWLAFDDNNAKMAHDDVQTLGGIEQAVRTLKSVPSAIASGFPRMASGFYGFTAAPFEAAGQVFGGAEDWLASLMGAQGYKSDNAGKVIGGTLRGIAQDQQALTARVYTPPKDAGIIERGVGSGLQSAVQSVVSAPFALRQQGEQAALALMGATTFGSSYLKATDKGKTPLEAIPFASADAVAEVVTEKYFGFSGLMAQVRAGSSAAKMFVYEIVKETPGEIGATIWQNFNEWTILNPDKSVSEWFAEQPEAIGETIVATLVGGGAQVGAIKGTQKVLGRMAGEEGRAQQAEQHAAAIEQLGKLGAASKLNARDATTFKALVAQIADEEGDAPTQFFIDPATLANSLNQSGVTMAELEAMAPTVAKQLQSPTGGDIRVPVSEFMAAGEELTMPLIDHIRISEDAMTRAEAQEYLKTQGDTIKADVERELQGRDDQEQFRQSIDGVRTQFEAELNNAKRFTPAVNKAYSELLANFYGATASRLGMTPEALLDKYKLRVQSTAAGGARQMDQPAYHGTPHTVDKFTTQKIGTGEGAQAYGWGMYFAGNKDIADFYRKTLSGSHITDKLKQALAARKAQIQQTQNPDTKAALEADVPRMEAEIAARKDGNTYKVEIPEDSDMLDYDASVKDQSPKVRAALEKAGVPLKTVMVIDPDSGLPHGEYETLDQARRAITRNNWKASIETVDNVQPGKDVYRKLSMKLGGDEAASKALLAAGIPGLRFLDADSRGTFAKGDTRNYVVFDDSFVGTPEVATFNQSATDQTQTEAFSKWFGDSKVVDADGKPLVVYHGTEAVFDTFSIGKIKSFNEGVGLYFTNNPTVAGSYGKPMSVFLSLQKPLAYDAKAFKPAVMQKVLKRAAEIEAKRTEMDLEDGFLSNYGDVRSDGLARVLREAAAQLANEETANDQIGGLFNGGLAFEDLAAAVRDVTGHDGFVATGFSNEGTSDNAIYVAWFPEQIKSATGNRGTFDPNDPNILNQGEDTPRAQISFAEDITKAPSVISLLAGADLSSFIHESGHFFLEAQSDLAVKIQQQIDSGASVTQAERGIVDDMNALLKWFVVTGRESVSGATGGALDQSAVAAQPDLFNGEFATKRTKVKTGVVVDGKGTIGEGGNTNSKGQQVTATKQGLQRFWNWFAGSEAEDERGRPLVLYHSTNSDITRFETNRETTNNYGLLGEMAVRRAGIFLTPDLKFSQEYLRSGAGQNVMQVYASLKNPLDLRRGISEVVEAELEAAGVNVRYVNNAQNAWELFDSADDGTNDFVTGLMAAGYDGAIFREDSPGGESEGGTTYVVFDSAQLKSATGNRGTFDPKDASILNQGGEEIPPPDGPSPQGRTPLETWSMMSLDEKRHYHEQFARGFERYSMEGHAPSIALQEVFSRFRSWLIQVYKTLRGLNAELNDDVRAVMGRMLATDFAIEEAEAQRSMGPLFKDADSAGMTLDEFSAYQAAAQGATDKAAAELQVRGMKDMKWLSRAKDKALKARQQEVDELRREIKNEVRSEVMAEPVYQAWQFLTGKQQEVAPGAQAVDEIDAVQQSGKLRTQVLREMYGTEETAVWRELSARRMTSDEKGMHPEIVAEMFGYDSADAMVKTLADAMPPSEVIDARTDQRMLEMFGDITSEEALQRAADEAVHNEARARFIATEMKALEAANKVTERQGKTTVNVLARAAKDYAQQIIARLKVREIRPNQYAVAEARNAKLAEKALASGKREEAAAHKRNQLVNNYATRAAYDAQEEVKSAQKYFRKFDKRSKTIDAGYQDQIEQMLERFDFRQASLNEIDGRKSFAAWYAEQEALAEGGKAVLPQIPPELINEAGRKSYKDMTIEEIRGLRETIEQVEHLGRLKNRLLLARDQKDFGAAASEMAASIIEFGGKARPVQLEGPNPVVDWFAGVRAQHRKLASLFREMDGNKDAGPMYDLIGRGMNERGTMEDVMVEKATLALRDIYAPIMKLKGGTAGGKLYIPEIGASLSRGGRLSVALNWGNEANRQRIMDGDKWSEGQVRAILKTLTPVELKFVNDMWAYLDSFWPEVAAKEKRLTGIEPEKVEALPFNVTAADGTDVEMRGGYYPLKYDSDRSDRADQQEAAQAAKEMMQGAFTRATTRRGHTKERLQEVKRAVRKDLNVITQHITQVTHDLAWHEWLIDTNKLLADDRVVSAIRDHYGPRVLKTMRDNVMGIATADVAPQTAIDTALLKLRANVTRATMGASLTTAFLQPFGLTQSMVRIGPKHVLRGIARWGGEAVRMENSLAWIHEKSDFMRLRAKTFNKELREIRGSVSGKSKTMRVVDAGLFALMQKMQTVADVPTWIGQYEKSLAEGADEAAAVAMADRVVLESQGGGQTKDLAEVQRKHPMLTQFYSYFSVTLNLAAESTASTNFKNPAAVAGWLGDMALLMVIPAILPSLIMFGLKGGDDDDENGMAKRIADWQLGYLLGTVVLLREASGAVGGFDYAGPPVGRVLSAGARAYKQAAQGEVDEPLVLATIDLMGAAFGIPTVQILRSYKGWKAWDEGQEGAGPASVLFGPPPKK